MNNIKDIVKNKYAHLVFYIDGIFVYKIMVEGKNYIFRFNSEDVKEAELKPKEKAITLMGFIKNAIKNKEFDLEVLKHDEILSYATLKSYKNGKFYYDVPSLNQSYYCLESKILYTQNDLSFDRFSELFEKGVLIFCDF